MATNLKQPATNWASDPTLPSPANLTADHDNWHTLGRDLQYDGPYAKVYLETVATPARPEGVLWTVVRRKSAVVVAARTTDNRWLLIRQERIPIRQAIWEFPAGQIEVTADPATDFSQVLRDTVWRELREETGYTASAESRLWPLGVFYPSSGFTDEHSHLFLADAIIPHAGGAQPDEAERIVECRTFSTTEFRQMIVENVICDANTLATFAKLVALDLL